jgi:predicted nuclease of predicted toxin-antitoxin system
MTIWVDAQLSPALATWIREHAKVEAVALKELGLRDARDPEIFKQAREARAVVMTKDKDFVDLLYRHGPPPQVIWITAGNTSNDAMKKILSSALPAALEILRKGEVLVEVRG